MTVERTTTETIRPLLAGLFAYVVWGFFPLYFKLLTHIPPLAVVSHRILWSAIFLILIVVVQRKGSAIRGLLSHPRTLRLLMVTSILISLNWLVFIRAVEKGEVLQSSLGYFLTPIVNVILGVGVLGERLRRTQTVSVILAAGGVVIQVAEVGRVPVTALVLALTFGCYGLVRKVAKAEPIPALTIETLLLSLPALLLLSLSTTGTHPLGDGWRDLFFLSLSGVVTAVPLLLFGAATRSLRLATIGFLQYITPSLHFLQAVFIYREPFGTGELASFVMIWGALLIYSLDAIRHR
ncbi:MAG: EamA family transporter RarD [Desulfuromonadia bacterium]